MLYPTFLERKNFSGGSGRGRNLLSKYKKNSHFMLSSYFMLFSGVWGGGVKNLKKSRFMFYSRFMLFSSIFRIEKLYKYFVGGGGGGGGVF